MCKLSHVSIEYSEEDNTGVEQRYFVVLECSLERSNQIKRASILTVFHINFDTSTILGLSQKFFTIKSSKTVEYMYYIGNITN